MFLKRRLFYAQISFSEIFETIDTVISITTKNTIANKKTNAKMDPASNKKSSQNKRTPNLTSIPLSNPTNNLSY